MAQDDTQPTAARATWALAALSLSMLLSSLGTSVANVALPTIEDDFGAPFGQVQWVVLVYLLTLTTLVVSAGRLGDLAGRRRLLIAGLALFIVASALCAAAPSLLLLVAARAAQGAGAALMMALTLAFATAAVPAARTGAAMGLLGTTSALGTALGPSLGGALIAGPGWRAIFLVNIPLGMVALVLAHRHLPGDRPRTSAAPSRFDIVGTVLLALTLAAYCLAMTIGHGRFGAASALLLGATVAGAALFVVSQARVPTPIVQLAMLRDRILSGGLATSGLVSTVMMATLVVGPFYLSRALELNAALVGIVMSIGPAVVALTGVPAGRIADRVGASLLGTVGLAAMAVGAALLALTPARLGVAGYIAPMVVLTLGYAVFQTANNTAVMAGAHPEQRGVTSGLLNLSRNLGLITGASLMGTIFAIGAGTARLSSAPPEAVATGMHVTFGLATILIAVALAISANSRPARRRIPRSPRTQAREQQRSSTAR